MSPPTYKVPVPERVHPCGRAAAGIGRGLQERCPAPGAALTHRGRCGQARGPGRVWGEVYLTYTLQVGTAIASIRIDWAQGAKPLYWNALHRDCQEVAKWALGRRGLRCNGSFPKVQIFSGVEGAPGSNIQGEGRCLGTCPRTRGSLEHTGSRSRALRVLPCPSLPLRAFWASRP